MEPIKIALVGCGRISQVYLQSMAELTEFRLVGVADTRESAARSAAEQHKCPHFTDFRRLVEAEPEAVVVCTPPDTHRKICRFFLQERKDVFCEKPLALSSAESAEVVGEAERNGRLLMMGSKFRFVSDIIKAKGIIESGILGDVILFENVFCSKVDMRQRWNADPEVSGGGVLIDNGSHSVDIARYLLGPIAKVQAEAGKNVQGLSVEDTCRLYFRTESDIMGAIDLSWSIYKERDTYIDVFGSEGVLSVGWRFSKYRQSEKLEWVRFGNGYDKVAAFRAQMRNFALALRGQQPPLITAADSLASVEVIEAAYRSMAMDKWVEVEGVRSGVGS